MSRPTVAGSDLAARRSARQAYERPWVRSHTQPSIRNRPALQKPALDSGRQAQGKHHSSCWSLFGFFYGRDVRVVSWVAWPGRPLIPLPSAVCIMLLPSNLVITHVPVSPFHSFLTRCFILLSPWPWVLCSTWTWQFLGSLAKPRPVKEGLIATKIPLPPSSATSRRLSPGAARKSKIPVRIGAWTFKVDVSIWSPNPFDVVTLSLA